LSKQVLWYRALALKWVIQVPDKNWLVFAGTRAAGHSKMINKQAIKAVPIRRRMVRFQKSNFDRAAMAVRRIGSIVSTVVPGKISQPMAKDRNS
jgi:hypothetical protein